MSDEKAAQINNDKAKAEANGQSPAEDASDDPSLDLNELKAKIAELEQKAKENMDGWQRARAEFDNYKKRVAREKQTTYQNALVDVMKSVLPIIDDFERAFQNVPEELTDNPWINGTQGIGRKLAKLLEQYDIESIDPVGELFDPERHEAIGMDSETDVESGHVSETLQPGYIYGDRVLRPALVRVAS